MRQPCPLSPPPSRTDLAAAFWRIGVLSFGGPAAQIALLHRVVLEEKNWISEADYTRALSFCMLLPGPEAMQLATWIGWRLGGIAGGLIAGLLFLLPGAVIITVLAALYTTFGAMPLVPALFSGIQAAVVAIVALAMLRLAQKALLTTEARVIALLSFLGLFVFALPFPLILTAVALWGAFRARNAPRAAPPATPALTESLRQALIWLALWLLPLAGLVAFAPERLAELGLFFSRLAALAFGGAYPLMAWMGQEMVTQRGWLTTAEMIDGLALAEATPGPLILVTLFTGWIAGFEAGGTLMAAGGALVAVWMTFVPSFLFIFAAGPMIDRLLAVPVLAGAMARITPAVVGVIANLSLWFAFHVLFAGHNTISAGPVHLLLPDLTSMKPAAWLIALASGFALTRLRWPMLLVLGLAALAGLIPGLIPAPD